MRHYDFRKKDIVRFRKDLEEEDEETLTKFVGKIHDSASLKAVAHRAVKQANNRKPPLLTVVSDGITKKTKTPYVVVQDEAGYKFAVQSRYVKLMIRQPSHPLTGVFL